MGRSLIDITLVPACEPLLLHTALLCSQDNKLYGCLRYIKLRTALCAPFSLPLGVEASVFVCSAREHLE